MLAGVAGEYLKRWNGLPGTIADECVLSGDAIKRGQKLLWIAKPKNTVALSVPMGRGEIVICLLHIRGRVTRDGGTYDPVAERILVNLLTR